jgi:LysM repeat protein
MISANVSGWDRAARYWQGTPAAPAIEQTDPKTQELLDRHESLAAELDALERAIETQAQIVVGRANKAAAEKPQPRTAALTKFRHRDTSAESDEQTGRQILPAVIAVLFLAVAILAVVTLRGGNGDVTTIDLPVIPLGSPENPYTEGAIGVPTTTAPATTVDPASVVNDAAVSDATSPSAVAIAPVTLQPSPGPTLVVVPVVVQPGENVEVFADAYGTRIETITALNGLEDASLIFTGQTLLIPLGFDY